MLLKLTPVGVTESREPRVVVITHVVPAKNVQCDWNSRKVNVTCNSCPTKRIVQREGELTQLFCKNLNLQSVSPTHSIGQHNSKFWGRSDSLENEQDRKKDYLQIHTFGNFATLGIVFLWRIRSKLDNFRGKCSCYNRPLTRGRCIFVGCFCGFG